MTRRVFLTVLDSFGIGEAPDAAAFGDVGANTLAGVSGTGLLQLPHLTALGLGCIDGVSAIPKVAAPRAAHARLQERSMGKDTTIGHWEMAGLISENPLPTFPSGFPRELMEAFEKAVGRGTLCNLPYSGTDVIRDYGKEHVETGKLIVYTSADSVFQVAAHEEIVPLEELYAICRAARQLLTGKYGVGRVIARPFIGTAPDFKRTGNRRDFSLLPTGTTMLNKLSTAGLDVIGVGKIGDIFAMSGITESHPTHSNDEGMAKMAELLDRDFHGLCFVNLVDFDMKYGHRQDAVGYAKALNAFDRFLGTVLPRLSREDVLIVTADHGCDPTDNSTDHTREYVPFLMVGDGVAPENLGTVLGFDHVSRTVCNLLQID
ncbi:MAG: phosphopentomutase [Ruminococcaceae bacterium]|nr:phosphopentomutase [Oscillospiraceae bacterium]